MRTLRHLLLPALIAVAAAARVGADPIQNSDNGHFYEFVEDYISWTDAKATSAGRQYLGLQGYLATVTSQAENDFILAALLAPLGGGPRTGVWIGGCQDPSGAEPNGGWGWCVCTGEAFTYTNWEGSSPDNAGGCEEFIEMHLGSGKWGDAGNGPVPGGLDETRGYVIEYGGSVTLPCPTIACIEPCGPECDGALHAACDDQVDNDGDGCADYPDDRGCTSLSDDSEAEAGCPPPPVDTNLWVTNGPVLALARLGNTLYLGGSFTRVGPATGSGVPLDVTSGMPPQPFPKIVGTIYAVVAAPAGGWYVGGDFTYVGGKPKLNLAYVLPDGSVADWGLSPDGPVKALAVGTGALYVGGSFTQIAGLPRNHLAAVDHGYGIPTPWDPNADGTVEALAVSGNSPVYVGGSFTHVGGEPRNRLAQVYPSDGTLTTWDPNADATVLSLLLASSSVYAGGDFTTVGGQPRNRAARLALGGTVLAWDANADASVRAMWAAGTIVYVGGDFTSIGGQTRNRLAALDRSTGLATAWDPGANGTVRALALSGTALHAGGDFTNIGGQPRNYIAALDATSGLATGWNPDAGARVRGLALNGSVLYAGGDFTSLNGQARKNVAALDLAGGGPTAWVPEANNTVYALATDGATVYAGGLFSMIGGQSRNRIAALDAASGTATLWNPNASAPVRALAVDGSVVYAGGNFTAIGGQTRRKIAALDAASGLATAFDNPSSGGPAIAVSALASSGSIVYACGNFTALGGLPRNHLAALDATSGLATDWDPQADSFIQAVLVDGSTVYAGGDFTWIGGADRYYIAALDASTGLATSWDPSADGSVRALGMNGAMVCAGGDFTAIGGQPRLGLAAIDPATGLARSWNPSANGPVMALALDGAFVFAGGGFTAIDAEPQSFLAAIGAWPGTVGVGETPTAALSLRLYSPWPNPTRGSCTLAFELPRASTIRADVMDLQGRIVRNLAAGRLFGPGRWSLAWDGRDRAGLPAASGVYFARVRAGSASLVRKFVVLR